MSSRNTMNILFNIVKDIKTPIKTFFIKTENKNMLGRWGSVKEPKRPLNYNNGYGYDCAREFNSIIITNKEKN